jgi:hypothetical protein
MLRSNKGSKSWATNPSSTTFWLSGCKSCLAAPHLDFGVFTTELVFGKHGGESRQQKQRDFGVNAILKWQLNNLSIDKFTPPFWQLQSHPIFCTQG